MPSETALEVIRRQLFGVDEKMATYGIFDGAAMPGLPQALEEALEEENIESVCLLKGDLEPDVAQAAPYLVRMAADSAFTKWVLKEGWGQHWGVFVRSPADLRRMRMHFRALLNVYGPDMEPLFFRYYDPRVLRTYLPTCTSDELNSVFGPAEAFVMEHEDAKVLLRCALENDRLNYEEFLLK